MVEVARVDGQWIYNPTIQQTEQGDARLFVAGTKDGIWMVEGNANEMSEVSHSSMYVYRTWFD